MDALHFGKLFLAPTVSSHSIVYGPSSSGRTHLPLQTVPCLQPVSSARLPPNTCLDDWLTYFRSGLWRLHYKLSPEGRKRFFTEFLPLLHDTKESILGARDADSWYLVYIGTRPSAQGNGYCRRLIEDVTQRCDLEAVDGKVRPVYLESSHPNNVGLYRKFGFEIRRTVHLQRAEKGVELDIMVREPKRGINS
jgi:GNAT superfamily N-acetyltransferase